MVEINFRKLGNKPKETWESEELLVEDAFNLHIEQSIPGHVTVLVKGNPDGEWAVGYKGTGNYGGQVSHVFDWDFQALVYPKYVKVLVHSEPTVASVEGEGVEVVPFPPVKEFPVMEIKAGSDTSPIVTTNFDLPNFDESSKIVIKVKGNNINYDIESDFYAPPNIITFPYDEEFPPEMGNIAMVQDATNKYHIYIFDTASQDYTFQVLSIDHQGSQIYP